MLHRTVWEARSANSKKKVSYIPGEGIENVNVELYGTHGPPVRKKKLFLD